MIGVLVHSTQEEIAREFFELFKTPWEFCKSGQRYDVLISTRDEWPHDQANLTLLFNAERISFDADNRIPVRACSEGTALSYGGRRFPIYGKAVTFPASRLALLDDERGQQSMAWMSDSGHPAVVRLGYDLYEEVRWLLSAGQPPANAGTPALELHIALLRELITRSGMPLVEIPPIPDGYNLIACLTHDIDHPVLRNHFMDHTMLGFLYRATVGSVMEVCRGRKGVGSLCKNWGAAAKLPLVYLGMARDPWRGFVRYLEMEEGLGSTYFVMPQREYAGRCADGPAPAKRASRYAVSDITSELKEIVSRGNEVALHGIDAWLDPDSARKEQQELTRALGDAGSGVRMHWLFLDGNSPALLEKAGFSYDASVGYNETVGYRAGTAQAYKPCGTATLLELPLQVMDTALFFPEFLNLSEADAEHLVWGLLDDVARFGGALTINWHDRSIAPERLWAGFYLKLLSELKKRGAWSPTAAQAVSWFRKRRSVTFGPVSWEEGQVSLSASASTDLESPGLRFRVHRPQAYNLIDEPPRNSSAAFVDLGFKTNLDKNITLTAFGSRNACCWVAQDGGLQPPLAQPVSAN
jgi:hypothetical protein